MRFEPLILHAKLWLATCRTACWNSKMSILALLSFGYLIQCKTANLIVVSKQKQDTINFKSIAIADSVMLKKLAPFKLTLDKKMNDTVNFAATKLEKERPEGSLGNLITESLMKYVGEKGFNSDLCLITFGGIRLPEIPEGLVTVGRVYELQPFDNELVILNIRGDSLQKLLHFVASRNGDPINGVTFKIVNKKAVNVQIGGQSISDQEHYNLLTSDYLANGGDNLFMLAKPIKYQQTGIGVRDALIAYWKLLRQRNQPLTAKKDGRISLE